MKSRQRGSFMANLFYYQRPDHSDTDIVTRWIFWGTSNSKQLTTLWLSPSAVVLAFSADVSLLQGEVFEDFFTSSCWDATCCVEESLLDISSLKEKKRAVQYFILIFFALERKYIKSTLNLFLQNRHGKF